MFCEVKYHNRKCMKDFHKITQKIWGPKSKNLITIFLSIVNSAIIFVWALSPNIKTHDKTIDLDRRIILSKLNTINSVSAF